MLSLRDCFAFSELTDDEVQVIAEHEHIPEIVAAELGNGSSTPTTAWSMIKAYMLDCIEHARRNGHFDRADALYAALPPLRRRAPRDRVALALPAPRLLVERPQLGKPFGDARLQPAIGRVIPAHVRHPVRKIGSRRRRTPSASSWA